MSTPSLSPAEACSLRSFCSRQLNTQLTPSPENAQKLIQRVDRALARGVLCPHTPEQMLLLHKSIEQIEREEIPIPEGQLSSVQVTERVQNAIRSLLSAPSEQATPQHLINLYYLSQFPPLAPPGVSLTDDVLKRRKEKGGAFAPELVGRQLPYCVSKERFLDDLHILTGLEKDTPHACVERPLKILKLNAELRERRCVFLERQNAADYLPYLDQLLEGSFLHLYNYLLSIVEQADRNEHRKEIRQFEASELSRIVLDVRHAIVSHVKHMVKRGHPNVIFLVGNTGSGKSTTTALLQGDRLERKGDYYEVPDQNTIGHSLTTSFTFLPNVRSNPNCVYVDFPGFNDTRGELIDLGIELAFKTLVNRYKPKVVIVESIKALESSRGAHVANLGKKLRRMLGETAPCSLFLTQYLQLAEYVRLENLLDKEKGLTERIEKLKGSISRQEEAVAMLEQGGLRGPEKVQGQNQVIQDLEQEIQELEEQERLGKLNSRNERRLISCREDLSKEKQRLKKQLRKKKEKIERERAKILVKSQELVTCKERIAQANEGLREKSQKLLELLGFNTEELGVAELRDLESPKALTTCRRILDRAKPTESVRKKISDDYRTALIGQFKQALTGGGLPPPPAVEVDDLQHRILETSLTAVLTAERFPEIGEFFHLPEMEPQCVEDLDSHIVSEFSDALIRLIVIGSSNKESAEDTVKDSIEEQIESLGKKQKKEADRLKEKWGSLKQRVLDSSATGAVDWKDLEQHYRSRLTATFDSIAGEKKKHLEEWDEWAANFFKIRQIVIGLPKIFYGDRANHSADQITAKGIEKTIDSLDQSFDKVRELRKIVENRRAIEEQRQRCVCALEDPNRFTEKVQSAIEQTRQIYDKGAKEEETWVCRMKKVKAQIDTALNWASLKPQANSPLAYLMCVELCSQEGANGESLIQLVTNLTNAPLDFSSIKENLTKLEKPLGVEGDFEKEDLLNRVRSVNQELSRRAGLNLDIGLHRILLFDFLKMG